MSGDCDKCNENCLDCGCLKEEDTFLRNLLEKSPSYLDIEDPTPIYFDSKTFEWISAKQLMQRSRPVP